MSDTIDYIDDYFTGALDENARKEFEAKCENDEPFASEVAFYIMARQSVKNVLLEQKKEIWKDELSKIVIMKPVKKTNVLKWASYAAACLAFIIAGYFLFYQPTPQSLADHYINSYHLGQTMDASHDSIQAGIADLQAGDYKNALVMFEGVRKRDTKNDEAKKFAGYTYLRLQDYDKALERFRELSSMTNLQSNSGDIMQAVTFLKRDAPGDEEAAKALLEKVVSEDEEGSKDAKEILDRW